MVVDDVEDIIHLGPTLLHYMMPFERMNGVMQGYIRNRSHPDASMAKGFLTYECVSFCQNYLSTKNQNVGMPTRKHLGRLIGYGHCEGSSSTFVGMHGQKDDFKRAHRVALQHLQLIETWVELHKCLLEQQFIKLGRPRKKGDVTIADRKSVV